MPNTFRQILANGGPDARFVVEAILYAEVCFPLFLQRPFHIVLWHPFLVLIQTQYKHYKVESSKMTSMFYLSSVESKIPVRVGLIPRARKPDGPSFCWGRYNRFWDRERPDPSQRRSLRFGPLFRFWHRISRTGAGSGSCAWSRDQWHRWWNAHDKFGTGKLNRFLQSKIFSKNVFIIWQH